MPTKLSLPSVIVGFLLFSMAAGTPASAQDTTSPSCSSATVVGPPKQFQIIIQDTASGLNSIVVTLSNNADTVVPPFTPGTTSAVSVTSTKIDQSKPMIIEIRATDVASNTSICFFTDDVAGPSCTRTGIDPAVSRAGWQVAGLP